MRWLKGGRTTCDPAQCDDGAQNLHASQRSRVFRLYLAGIGKHLGEDEGGEAFLGDAGVKQVVRSPFKASCFDKIETEASCWQLMSSKIESVNDVARSVLVRLSGSAVGL